MTPIGPHHALAGLLAQQVTSLHATRPGPRGAPRAAAATGTDLTSLAAQRIGALARDDPQRKPKALRIFLETVLLQQFGAGVANDAQFPAWVSAVQDDIAADRHMAALADALAEHLVRQPG